MLVRMIASALLMALLSACAAFPLTMAQECKAQGAPKGSPGYEACKQRSIQRAAQIERENWRAVGDIAATALVATAAVEAAKGQAYVSPTPTVSNSARPTLTIAPMAPVTLSPSSGGSGAQSVTRTSMCPNGSYVSGSQCVLAPDGTYTSGRPTIAPDGTYVTGRPTMAPDGSFVGGKGSLTLCPDGKYVAGGSCVLAPDGSYVGKP